MPKPMLAFLIALALAIVAGGATAQDDAICAVLREIHAIHGDKLAAYLSEKGLDCVNLPIALTPTPTLEAAPIPGSQGLQDGCYPHDIAYVNREYVIRESPHQNSATVAKGQTGDIVQVLSSTRVGFFCMIETRKGWVTGVSISPVAPAEETGCYLERHAFVTGTVNLRAEPTTASAKVGQAHNGGVDEVSESVQGDTYCWLKVSDGWMAQTAVAHGRLPAAA